MLLESYVAGSLAHAADEGAPLLDATTGAEVARVSTAPVPAPDALAARARRSAAPRCGR